MRIWLVNVGEPLPTDGGGERLLRMGLLAELLHDAGHEIDWWTSSFNHVAKCQRALHDTLLQVADGYRIRLLHGTAYPTNISWQRMWNHRQVATRFKAGIRAASPPDVILSSLPLWELCDVATHYGLKQGVPVVLDVRDMWPDAIVDLAPRWCRPMARWMFLPAYQAVRRSVSRATAITGITNGAVQWALSHVGRTPGRWDAAFPFGYCARVPPFSERNQADAYWDSLGLTGRREFLVCFLGTMGPHFEIETIVEAARQLANSGRSVKFVLCGAGPQQEHWRRLSAQQSNIVFAGWVNAAGIWTLMRRSAVGLAPYVGSWDFTLSIPNKPIEYLSAGLPVVSSLKGELSDLLAKHQCGITYENQQPDQLARAIADLYDRPIRRHRLADNALRLYQAEFKAEDVYGRMRSYLEDVAISYSAKRNHALAA